MKRPLSPEEEIEELRVQLENLRRSLVEIEEDWVARGLSSVRNPVADNVRRDIAEKEALL